jgi:hypothetical protein
MGRFGWCDLGGARFGRCRDLGLRGDLDVGLMESGGGGGWVLSGRCLPPEKGRKRWWMLDGGLWLSCNGSGFWVGDTKQ